MHTLFTYSLIPMRGDTREDIIQSLHACYCATQAWYLLGPVTRYADEKKVQYELAGVHFVVERINDENKDHSFRVKDLATVSRAPIDIGHASMSRC